MVIILLANFHLISGFNLADFNFKPLYLVMLLSARFKSYLLLVIKLMIHHRVTHCPRLSVVTLFFLQPPAFFTVLNYLDGSIVTHGGYGKFLTHNLFLLAASPAVLPTLDGILPKS